MSRTAAAAWIVAILLAGSAQVAPPRPQTSAATASLGGRVVDRDDTTAAVAGARVTLFRQPGDQPVRDTITDAGGRFVFPQLTAGSYQVSATLPGWLLTRFGQKKPDRSGTTVVLAERESLLDLTIGMFRGSVISGRAVGANGQPMAGVVVQVFRMRYSEAGRYLTSIQNTSTDDRGQYRVFGLSPSEYVVRAIPSTGGRMGIADPALSVQPTAAEGYTPMFFPSASVPGQAETIPLGAGAERAGVDFTFGLVPLVRVRGVLTGPNGPVANASFRRVFDDGLLRSGDNVESQNVANGEFVLANIPPGTLNLTVRMTPAMQRGGIPQGPGGNNAGTLWGVARIAVGDRDVSDITIQMTPGAIVTGNVRFSGSTPPPDLSQRSALPGIGLIQAGPSPLGVGEFIGGPVEADGRFTIGGAPPGLYYVVAINPVVPWSLQSVTVDGRDRTTTAIEVAGDMSDVIVTLSDRTTSLSGALAVPEGSSATDYTVVVFPADAAARSTPSLAVFASRVDTSGRYSVPRIFPGEYLVAVTDDIEPNAWFDPRIREQLARAATPVTIAAGQSKVQDLRIAR